jgi:hypothetical protein
MCANIVDCFYGRRSAGGFFSRVAYQCEAQHMVAYRRQSIGGQVKECKMTDLTECQKMPFFGHAFWPHNKRQAAKNVLIGRFSKYKKMVFIV